MALLLAGSALGIAGCAQQRTEGYYDPPAESTVTDAQSQAPAPATAPSCAHRRKCRSRSSPTPPQDREPAGPGRASGHTTEDGQPVPEGADSGAASGVAASGAAPAPALPASTPSAAAHSLVPQPQTHMGTLPCFSPAMQCTAQRVTLTLALAAAGASPTWKATPSRARRWSSKAAGTPPTNARRA